MCFALVDATSIPDQGFSTMFMTSGFYQRSMVINKAEADFFCNDKTCFRGSEIRVQVPFQFFTIRFTKIYTRS